MNNNNNSAEAPKKGNKKRWFFWGLGLVATGVLSFFGFEYWKDHKQKSKTPVKNAPDTKAQKPKPFVRPIPKSKSASKPQTGYKSATGKTNPASTSKASAGTTIIFPLKKGAKGEKIKALQIALMRKHGSKILPNEGANGIFGSELEATLKKLNQPQVINESVYNLIIQEGKINADAIAKDLHSAALNKDFNKVIAQLSLIRNTKEFDEVNKLFKDKILRSVRQTIVTGLLGTFSSEIQKAAIRLAFISIGLTYDGKKWSLSGLEGADSKPLLITTQATKVWKDPKTSVPVPVNMVLGKEIDRKKNFSLFENDRQYFLVESNHVNYYKN